MFSLQDLLGQQQGNAAVDQISQNVGADSSMVNTAIQYALPAILGGLANNAADPAGAQSLNNALEQDHSGGGVLGNLGGLSDMIFGGGQQAAPPREADAGGILGHIFGNQQGQVAQQVSERSGLGLGQVAQILMMLAPIVMSYLGQRKQQENVGAGGLGDLIGGILPGGPAATQGGGLGDILGGILGGGQQQQSSGGLGSLAGRMLDRDGDGSAMDDIASMAFRNITGR